MRAWGHAHTMHRRVCGERAGVCWCMAIRPSPDHVVLMQVATLVADAHVSHLAVRGAASPRSVNGERMRDDGAEENGSAPSTGLELFLMQSTLTDRFHHAHHDGSVSPCPPPPPTDRHGGRGYPSSCCFPWTNSHADRLSCRCTVQSADEVIRLDHPSYPYCPSHPQPPFRSHTSPTPPPPP